jgi:hypothetical protein
MIRTALLAGACALAMIGSASAATLVGLQGDDTLVTFDSRERAVIATVRVQGVRLHGIDVRPADGMLYGLTREGRVVTIDPVSGAVTEKSRLNVQLDPNVRYSIDFNPMADRLRIMGQDGSSYRTNVDDGVTATDGRLRYAEGDANRATTPRVATFAYSNSVRGTTATVLYNIDSAAGTLVRQVPPNDGVLNTIGTPSVGLSGMVAFNIASDGQGGNTGYLMVGPTLHMIDISNGAVTVAGPVRGLNGGLSKIAVIRN